MTEKEQNQAAFEQGRLSAWLGRVHKGSGLPTELHKEWERGVAKQCAVMSAEAAKIPLTWPDQMKSGARAD